MSGEDAFIRRHFASWAGPGALGLRDDAALLAPPPGCDLVLTTDAIVAGVHFLPDDPPGDVARKVLRVNLSDLAAKGADPLGFLLTLGLPSGFSEPEVSLFAAALHADSERFACPLLGGDTVATPGPLTVSITALGSVPHGRMVRRDGASAGHRLYVTGTVGDAALGLLVLRGDGRVNGLAAPHRDVLVERYRVPSPRTGLVAALRAQAWAAMDVSDGFAGDLAKLLEPASLGVAINVADVPLSDAARTAVDADPTLWPVVLGGGDDYEIACAVPPGNAALFEEAAAAVGIPVTAVGDLDGSGQVTFIDEDGRTIRLDRPSYSHV